MKRLFLLMVAVVTVLLSGCGGRVTSYMVEKDGHTYQVDTVEQKISEDGQVSRYRISPGKIENFSVIISFLDGSVYEWRPGSAVLYNEDILSDARQEKMERGERLAEVLYDLEDQYTLYTVPFERNYSRGVQIVIFIVTKVLFFLLGIFCVFAPRRVWNLACGWLKYIEPSRRMLLLIRIAGGFCIAGVILKLLTFKGW